MTGKLHKILIGALISVWICALLGFTFTKARYSEEADPGNHTGELEYTVADQLEIRTVEEFFAAINNGYNNIKIADGVANPFLVTGSADVTADLILDLNGHDIQRNDREPMLTIKEGVKMIVTDTNPKKGGSFYNPVGSVLNIDGGILTILEGQFESGVREAEYSNNSSSTTKGKVEANVLVNVSVKNGNVYIEETKQMPIIMPSVSKASAGEPGIDGNSYYVNGNLYFPSASGSNIDADTYLYFTFKDNDVATETIMPSKGSANFYYTYYLKKAVGADYKPSYTYAGLTQDQDKSLIEVTIYGYNQVLAAAKNEAAELGYTPQNPSDFAAINMESGELYTRGGSFFSHFGVESADCINAAGGNMTVITGNFEAKKDGICINCKFATETSGKLNVENGTFKSYRGNIIQVESGTMTLTGGKFTKDASAYSKPGEINADTNNKAAIRLEGGNLIAEGKNYQDDYISFNIYGSYTSAIKCLENSTAKISNAKFEFNNDKIYTPEEPSNAKQNNIGIFSVGGVITVGDCLFEMPDADDTGISSTVNTENAAEGGGNNVSSASLTVYSTQFSLSGERATGIYANTGNVTLGREEGIGEVGKDRYVMFYIDHVKDCYGVKVEKADNSTVPKITVYTAQIFMGQKYYATENVMPVGEPFQGAGIMVDVGDKNDTQDTSADLDVGRLVVYTAGSYTAGIWMKSGTFRHVYSDKYKLALCVGVLHDFYDVGGKYNETLSYSGKPDLSAAGVKGHYREKFGEKLLITQYGAGNYNVDVTQSLEKNLKYNTTSSKSLGSYGVYSQGGVIEFGNVFLMLQSEKGSGIYISDEGRNDAKNFDCLVNTGATKISSSAIETRYVYDGGSYKVCTVNINRSEIISDNYGLRLEGGTLNFADGETVIEGVNGYQNSIYTTRAAAIYSTSTNAPSELNVNNSLNVNCLLNGNVRDADGKSIEATHGIYWQGGDMNCSGDLKIDFTGLENDNIDEKNISGDYAIYAHVVIKSYAIYVSGGNFNVINKLSVRSQVGGGVSVNNGNVTIGDSESVQNDITVFTLGNTYNGSFNVIKGINIGSWRAPQNSTGGHAMAVSGGNVTVYNGKFVASLGNGIVVNGTETGNSDNIRIDIKNGTFNGWFGAELTDDGEKKRLSNTAVNDSYDEAFIRDQNYGGKNSGPGAYYGLKVMGGSHLDIYGGAFDGGNGGAFVTGITKITGLYSVSGLLGVKALVHVYEGTFGSGNLDGFNVYDHCEVIFGAYNQTELAGKTPKDLIKINAYNADIAINPIAASNNWGGASVQRESNVYVYYGTYNLSNTNGNIFYYGNKEGYAHWYTRNVRAGYVSSTNTVNTDDRLKQYTDKIYYWAGV